MQVADRIDDVFTAARDSIGIMAYLYGESLEVPEADIQKLKEMRDNSSFDYMEFINKDGLNTTAEGATSDASDQECGYSYAGTQGIGNAYLTGISNSDLMLIQTFPSAVTDYMIDEANASGVDLEIQLITAFGIYIICLLLSRWKQKKRLISEKQEMSQIVSGDEAIEKLQNDGEYAVVILDWKMPGKCGVETTREIRSKRSRRWMRFAVNRKSIMIWCLWIYRCRL